MNNSVLDVVVRSVALAAFLETPREVDIITHDTTVRRPANRWLVRTWARLHRTLGPVRPARSAGKRPGRSAVGLGGYRDAAA